MTEPAGFAPPAPGAEGLGASAPPAPRGGQRCPVHGTMQRLRNGFGLSAAAGRRSAPWQHARRLVLDGAPAEPRRAGAWLVPGIAGGGRCGMRPGHLAVAASACALLASALVRSAVLGFAALGRTVRVRVLLACVLLAFVLLAAGIRPAAAQDKVAVGGAGSRLAISVVAPDAPDAPLRSGTDLEVRLAVLRAESDAPPDAAAPLAWVRRLAPGQPACSTAAYTARATGVISPDDIPLARSYLIAVGDGNGRGREDHLRVVDLTHRLNTANQISVTPLGGRAAALLVHPGKPRAFLSRPEVGDVVAVDLPWGGAAPFAAGLDRPGALAALGGGLVVAEDAATGRIVRLDADGRRLATVEVGAAPVRLLGAGSGVLAAGADGTAVLLAETGAVVRLAGLNGALAVGRDALLGAGTGATAQLRWLDDPATAQPLVLPFAPDGFAFSAHERFAIAWSDASRRGVVIDLASGTTGHEFALPDAVEEAAVAGPALVLTHPRLPLASVVDLSPVAAGALPVVRRIRLPLPSGDPAAASPGTAPAGGRLIGSREAASALTVRPGSNVAFVLAAGGGLSDQPMSAITIRGDVPRRIARFDQQPTRTGPGRYSAPLRLQRGGHYEVVATSGARGATRCEAFFAAGPGADEAPRPELRMVGEAPRAGTASALELAIADAPPGLSGSVQVRFDDLSFGWSRTMTAELGHGARLRLQMAFPEAGTYAVSLPAFGTAVAPLLVGVSP